MSSSIAKLRGKFGRNAEAKKKQREKNSVNKITICELASNSYFHDAIRKKINIVGAGLSGLFCGWILGHAGCEVNIYEARDRIGGRVLTNFDNGRLIEEGGELIGLCHPLWLHLAKYFGLSFSVLIPEEDHEGCGLSMQVVIDGRVLSNEEISKAETGLEKILMLVSDDANKIKYPSQPWRESQDIQNLDKISVSQKLDEWDLDIDGRKLFELQQEADNGSYCTAQSYLGLLCQAKVRENFDAKNFWDTVEIFRCSNGNQTLAKKLSKGKNMNIHLNSICTHISYNKSINLKMSDDKIYESDFLIVTVPPSTLDNISFSPELEKNKYTPPMGIGRKIISKVNSRFWIKENLSPNGMSTNLGNIWEPTENQMIMSQEQNIYLSAFLGDPAAPTDTGDEFSNKMDKLFNNVYTKNVISKKLIDWPNDIYAKGSYSYSGIGVSTSIGKNLYYPVKEYDNKLLFAGEHTHMSLYGYMEGALETGLRSAIQIIEMCSENNLKAQKILEILTYIDLDKD